MQLQLWGKANVSVNIVFQVIFIHTDVFAGHNMSRYTSDIATRLFDLQRHVEAQCLTYKTTHCQIP